MYVSGRTTFVHVRHIAHLQICTRLLFFCEIEKGIYIRARATNIQFTYEFARDSHFFGNLRKESTYSTYRTLEITLSRIFPLLPAGIKLLWLLVETTIITSANDMLEVGCANF